MLDSYFFRNDLPKRKTTPSKTTPETNPIYISSKATSVKDPEFEFTLLSPRF
jgi:hypothetical protein